MKITYIHHSAFLAETSHACLLFDYFEGTLPEIPAEKPLYVFASHRHPDHFSKVIFDLADGHPDCTFVLSSDIWRKRVPEGEDHFSDAGRKAGDRGNYSRNLPFHGRRRRLLVYGGRKGTLPCR